MRRAFRGGLLATLDSDRGWGLVERGTVVTDGDRIVWVGADDALSGGQRIDEELPLDGRLVTPGLVDCHTHLVYGGDRAREFERRLEGATYEEIARAGGGIRSTVRATREADDEALFRSAAGRARALMADGVTTLEVKSGYGLTERDEARCLRVARRLGAELALQVVTTCLAAHAVPPEYDGRADDYVDAVCSWLPALHREGLVDAVDAFCETIGFTRAQTRRVFEAARRLGLPVKLHAEQLSDQDGAALAAGFGALSCDHLEHLSAAGVAAMAKAGTVAVLLPGAYFCLRETTLPPVDALRAAGVPMAVSTDHNPGTSPVLSAQAMLSMACTQFRLTPEEAVRGMTVNAAKALGFADRGRLAPGQRADFAAWPVGGPAELCYWLGAHWAPRVVYGGALRADG
jgi:imidazolonepropionase